VARYGVRQVVLTFSTAPNDVFLALVKRCNELGLGVSIVPRLFERLPDRLELDRLGGLPLMTVRPSNPHGIQYAVKYGLDPIIAAAIVVLLSPILLAVALAVWLDSGRPILFRQVRVGRDGRKFTMLKFRSMRTDAEKDGRPVWAGENDPRVTRVGALIRKTRIDEIPQLWNVLKGDMAIVGPRPERPYFVERLREVIPYYDQRHTVKPGITGWAQVRYPYGASVQDAVEKLQYDLFYIKHMSLLFDLSILFETIKVIIFGRGR
jgi:exopolysaccharide biosynthesis polyprenyl glycosylphosphotransferase